MLTQYMFIGLLVRLPLTQFKSKTTNLVMIPVIFLTIVNTIVGMTWLHSLNANPETPPGDDPAESVFVLRDDYFVIAFILVSIPVIVFTFLVLVLLKLLCFYLAGDKRRNTVSLDGGTGSRGYGEFDDEDEQDPSEAEAVVSVYFKIMDKVTYRTFGITDDKVDDEAMKDSRNKPYFLNQKQCRMCLKYFS